SSSSSHLAVRHLQIEFGSVRPHVRSFCVNLSLTLVFPRHGVEAARVARPAAAFHFLAYGFVVL
ncbi:thioredoxin, partial [Burkholderia cenocepacia]